MRARGGALKSISIVKQMRAHPGSYKMGVFYFNFIKSWTCVSSKKNTSSRRYLLVKPGIRDCHI